LGLIGEAAPTRDPRLTVTPLYQERLILTARPEHPFVGEGPIPMARLADATLVFYDRGSDDYELAQTMLRAAKVTPYGVIEVDSVDTARRLVALGLGVAWLPSTTAAPEFEAGRLAALELADAPETRRRIVALELADASSWVPVDTLRRLLGEVPAFVPGAVPIGHAASRPESATG
jgi:DNA-binding transcriptional LysR family regulator